MPMAIEIVLNGQSRTLATARTVAELVREELRLDPRTVAVERNGAIVPRADHATVRLEPGDRLEVVHFVQGG